MQARRALLLCLVAALCWLGAVPARAADAPDLLLEVRLDKHLLSEGIGAYQHNGEVLLPLGEMARLLTIAIRTDPAAGIASGYILDEQHGFHLDLAQLQVSRKDRRETLDPARLRRQGDDIYVALPLLAAWLPADLEVDLPSLTLVVRPRARLPVQARLERQGRTLAVAGTASANAGYPRHASPYRLAELPFIDQTIGLDLRRSGGRTSAVGAYTAYLTADLAGMEAALYLNTGKMARGPAARLTLARHDPDAGLLGPLQARTVDIGSVASAGLANVAVSSATGNGLLVSNRPLGQPTRFDRHSLQGDLPPGWDVELYFNEALIGFQQAGADGKYNFPDQALVYGQNEFRLVFHGPLGQLRVERHSFLLEQSLLAPGELQYSVNSQRAPDGGGRHSARVDLGLARQLSASAAVLRLPPGGAANDGTQDYASAGLHGYWNGFIVDAQGARQQGGGSLAQLGVKTRVGRVALAASRARLDDFSSEVFVPSVDPVRLRDELRLDGMLAFLPVSLQARRDVLASGRSNSELSARVSAYRHGTAMSNSLRWKSLGGQELADGLLQVSRRMAGIGLSGQLQYDLAPHQALSAIALAADKLIGDSYQLNLGLTRTFLAPEYRFSAALNKSLGSFGLGVHAEYSSRGALSAGIELFVALGREPRRGQWLSDAAPLAGSGAASVRVFLDKNLNGVMDGDDAPVKGAGFHLNGAGQLARTGEDGIAWLHRLPVHQHVDLALDPMTLEDPQWQPERKGMRLVPRPGKVSELEFAVRITGEIDGNAWLLTGGQQRGIGDIEIELVDASGALAGSATSGADGYYVMAGVVPGEYTLRVSPAQLQRLGLRGADTHRVTVAPDGNFVNGKNFVIQAK